MYFFTLRQILKIIMDYHKKIVDETSDKEITEDFFHPSSWPTREYVAHKLSSKFTSGSHQNKLIALTIASSDDYVRYKKMNKNDADDKMILTFKGIKLLTFTGFAIYYEENFGKTLALLISVVALTISVFALFS